MKSLNMKSIIKKTYHSCTGTLVLAAVLQLTLWPIQNAQAECSGADVDAARTACEAKSAEGYTFNGDNEVCRCQTTQERQQMRDNFLACQGSGAGTQECINNNALGSTALGENGGAAQDWISGIQAGITGMATTMALFNFLGAK
ncbi:MAG: hypothetical protein AABY86_07175, partial [Bdellovibrionota bacterium]